MRNVVLQHADYVRNWEAVPLEQFQKQLKARRKKKALPLSSSLPFDPRSA